MKPLPCQNPFAPKRAPPRKKQTLSGLEMDANKRAQEFGLDYNQAEIKLDDDLKLCFDFEAGEWLNDATGESYLRSQKKPVPKREKQVSSRELQKYQAQNQEMLEENNALRCKNEILIDMIAEVYSEFKLQKDLKGSSNKKDGKK